jgi:uncharacterized repeat protein (TIGR02543 family)
MLAGTPYIPALPTVITATENVIEVHYVPSAYIISYVLNGGTNVADNPTGYNVTNLPLSIFDATRVGYTFFGWTAWGGYTLNTPTSSLSIPAGTTGNITLTANWTPTVFTILFVDGIDGSVISEQQVAYGQFPAVPSDPTRPGYTFSGWSPTPSVVTGDAIYTAQWTAIPAGPTTPPAGPVTPPGGPVVTPVDPPAADPGVDEPADIPDTDTPVTPAPTPDPTPVDDPPVIPVPDPEPPLAAGGFWALVNLILAVLAFLIIIAFAAMLLSRRKGEDERYAQEDERDAQEDEEVKGSRGTIWGVLGIVVGIISPIVFLLTEDMTLPMQMVDMWTILMAAFVIIQIVLLAILWKVRRPDDNTRDRDRTYAAG